MIELRLNEQTGKYEKPGEPKFGRVYKVVDIETGKVGYNYTTSDLPGLEPSAIKMIEGYSTFRGWVTEIISRDDATAEVHRLNKLPVEFMETWYTHLVARVTKRLNERDESVIDGHGILDDMHELVGTILGRRQRPPLPGWKNSDHANAKFRDL